MANTNGPFSVVFSESTKAGFLQHLLEHPSTHRVSPAERDSLIEWLTNPHKRPASQAEFSRRNYARKTFTWNHATRSLTATATKLGEEDRPVITDDAIADTVEFVHANNGHAGWDTTWKDISKSYYGILRADVVYLLKRCQVCAGNPRKRPKGPIAALSGYQFIDQDASSLNFDDFFHPMDIQEVAQVDVYNILIDGQGGRQLSKAMTYTSPAIASALRPKFCPLEESHEACLRIAPGLAEALSFPFCDVFG